MNMIDEGSELLKWKSVEKSISELPNNSPVYLNPGFDEIGYGIKSKKYTSSTKQSPLEMLVETCKNIGHSLGLDEPLPNRKRTLLDIRDEEISVSSRKKQNLSPISYQSKSPSRLSVTEDRKHLKPIINVPVRTTPDTSGSPKISIENINKFENLSNFLPISSSLSDNSLNMYQDISLNSLSHHKNFNLESFINFQSLSPNPTDPNHRLSCDCFLCLLFSIKPLLLDSSQFPIQSKLNVYPAQTFETKSDLLFGSLTNRPNERQSPLGIEYCMYCGVHCLSIQMLLQHIHRCHLG